MARNMTMIEAAHGLLQRVTTATLTHSYRRTPSGFIALLTNKWEFLAASAGVPGKPITESQMRKQYASIRAMLHRLGYNYPDDNNAEERFDQLTRACFAMLGKNTKSEILWSQMLERQITFLDAFILVNQWVMNIEDARAERDGRKESIRLIQMNIREETRIRNSLAAIRDEIRMNRTRINQLEIIIGNLTQQEFDLLEELQQYAPTADSAPSPISRADSGSIRSQPGALAGDSGASPMGKIE